jgi:hypothetical protein
MLSLHVSLAELVSINPSPHSDVQRPYMYHPYYILPSATTLP